MESDIISSFLISLGFQVDERQRKKFDETIATVEKRMLELSAAAGSAAVAMTYAVKKISDNLADMYRTAQMSGSSTADVIAFGQAVELATGQAELGAKALTDFTLNLTQGIGTTIFEGYFKVPFDAAHSVNSIIVAIDELHKKYMAGDAATKIQILKEGELFKIPPELIRNEENYQRFKKDYADKRKQTAGLDEWGPLAANLKSNFDAVWQDISNMSAEMAGPLMTSMSALLEKTNDWLFKNHDWIVAWGTAQADGIITGLKGTWEEFMKIGNAVNWVIDKVLELVGDAYGTGIKAMVELFKSMAPLAESVGRKIHDALAWAFKPLHAIIDALRGMGLIGPAAASTPEASGAVSGAGTGAAPDGGVAGPHRGQKAILGGKGGMGGTAAGQVPGESSNPVLNAIDAATRGDSKTRQVLRNIYASESGHGDHWDVGDVNDGGAYSPFQYNMGPGRLGDKFQRDTGLDPRDPKNLQAIANYTAKYVREHPGADLTKIWHGLAHSERFGNLTGGYPPSMAVKPATPDHPLAKADAVGFHHALRAIQDFKPPMPWQTSMSHQDHRVVNSNVAVNVKGGFPVDKTEHPLERPKYATLIRNTISFAS